MLGTQIERLSLLSNHDLYSVVTMNGYNNEHNIRPVPVGSLSDDENNSHDEDVLVWREPFNANYNVVNEPNEGAALVPSQVLGDFIDIDVNADNDDNVDTSDENEDEGVVGDVREHSVEHRRHLIVGSEAESSSGGGEPSLLNNLNGFMNDLVGRNILNNLNEDHYHAGQSTSQSSSSKHNCQAHEAPNCTAEVVSDKLKYMSYDKRRRLLDHVLDGDFNKVELDDFEDSTCSYFIWSEQEAYMREVKQLGPSSCGPTALSNVLKALDFSVDPAELLKEVPVSYRVANAGLIRYLEARSCAGTTAHDLIHGVQQLSGGAIAGRFFPLYPLRAVNLFHWLSGWMRSGAVPLATMNPQVEKQLEYNYPVSDAWHHQMIHGISSDKVYLTNPLVSLPIDSFASQCSSDSTLLVRKIDVASQWTPSDRLRELTLNPRWSEMNVLGQVVCTLREVNHRGFGGFEPPSVHHIRIPASYRAGVTFFVRTSDVDLCHRLLSAAELPIMDDET